MNKYKVTPVATLPGDTGDAFPQITEADVAEIGVNAKQGDAAIVDDFVIKPGGANVVEGGDYALAGGLNINLFKPLRMWRGIDGSQFEDFDPAITTITIAPAHPTLDRIDLVYGKFEENIDGGQEVRHFKKDPADPGSLEGDISVFTEKQNKLTIQVLAGAPGPAATVPAIPSDGVPMYQITVRAGATVLSGNDVFDVRHNFDTLEEVNERVAVLEKDVNKLKNNDHRHDADEIDVAAPANALGNTVQDVLNALTAQNDDDVADPIFRPQLIRNNPALLPSNDGYYKVGSAGVLIGGTPSVDIPVGEEISFFGSPRRKIEPSKFPAVVEGVNINARTVNKDVNEATNSRSNAINLSLSVVTPISSDGGGSWELQGFALPLGLARSYYGQRLAAARDGRYIEVMGGGSGYGNSSWETVDTQTGVATTRVFTGDSPIWFIKGVFPVGDGIHVLVAQQPGVDVGANGGKLEWFKVDCVTGASVKYTGTAPGYTADATIGAGPSAVIGDLISTSPGVVMIMINVTGFNGHNSGINDNKIWLYHADTDSFELVTPIGQNPLSGLNLNIVLQDVDLCLYKPGQAVLVRGIGGIATYVFDLATRTWAKPNISQPAPDINTNESRLIGVTLANIGGRVQLTSHSSSVWELTPSEPAPQWTNIGLAPGLGNPAGASGRGFPGLVGMISSGLPRGAGYLLGGRVNNQPKADIWRFFAGGIVDTNCAGVAGIALGNGTNQATFRVNSIALPWTVGRVLVNPIGNLPAGSIRIRYSFDNGVTWQDIPRDAPVPVGVSGSNPTPIVEVTLIGTNSVRPCISKINELFEQLGAPGLVSTVIRFNVIPFGTAPNNGVRYLYIDRNGTITIEQSAMPSTADKAWLMKITPVNAAPPVPFDIVNARRIRRKYTATKSGGVDPTIANDFPVLPEFIKAWKVVSGDVFDLVDPFVALNTPITVTGLANGESVILELEA